MSKNNEINLNKHSKIKGINTWISFWVILVMVGLPPIFTDWLKNRFEVTAIDLVLPIILCLIISALVALFFYKRFLNNRFAALVGAIVLINLIGQKYSTRFDSVYQTLKPLNLFIGQDKYEGIFANIVLVGIIIILVNLIYKYLNNISKNWNKVIISNGLAIAIIVTFLLQFYTISRALINEWPEFSYSPPLISSDKGLGKQKPNKPDIYYIVLDRYTSQSVLESQFNFNNQEFTDYLKNNQFYVNSEAHSNYPYTTMSIASTLSANYLTDIVNKFSTKSDQILDPYHETIRYSPVIEELKSLGYSYYHLGSWYEASNYAPLSDHYFQPEGQLTIFNHTFTLDNFPKDELKENILFKFIEKGLKIGNFTIYSYSGQSESDATFSKINLLKQIAGETPGGKFVFAHILAPHEPFFFNEDGSFEINSGDNNIGKTIKQKYVDQVKFINSETEKIINKIKENDKNAIIVLQSDEGPYPNAMNGLVIGQDTIADNLDSGDMSLWSDNDLKMKFGVLAAYYLPNFEGKDLSQGGNSVNIFRLILNNYFGFNLNYLPNCNYALLDGKGKPMEYIDVTKKLTGLENPACSPNGSFK